MDVFFREKYRTFIGSNEWIFQQARCFFLVFFRSYRRVGCWSTLVWDIPGSAERWCAVFFGAAGCIYIAYSIQKSHIWNTWILVYTYTYAYKSVILIFKIGPIKKSYLWLHGTFLSKETPWTIDFEGTCSCSNEISTQKIPFFAASPKWNISQGHYGKSPFLLGKSTISMAIFNSYNWANRAQNNSITPKSDDW